MITLKLCKHDITFTTQAEIYINGNTQPDDKIAPVVWNSLAGILTLISSSGWMITFCQHFVFTIWLEGNIDVIICRMKHCSYHFVLSSYWMITMVGNISMDDNSDIIIWSHAYILLNICSYHLAVWQHCYYLLARWITSSLKFGVIIGWWMNKFIRLAEWQHCCSRFGVIIWPDKKNYLRMITLSFP
jgi:hypothetical protein